MPKTHDTKTADALRDIARRVNDLAELHDDAELRAAALVLVSKADAFASEASDDDFATPADAGPEERKAIDAIVRHVRSVDPDASGGGCRAFYTKEEWEDRGEEYGTDAVVVVVHDGGSLAPYFNMDYCAYEAHEAMIRVLRRAGFYVEQCTSWYSAVYRLGAS